MSITYLQPEHHALRYVPWARLRKDEDENVLGVLGIAFRLRGEETYLSATWVEYFTGSHSECVAEAVRAIRNSNLNPKPKSGFARGKVAEIDATLKAANRKIRFVHEPEDDNVAHAAFRAWPKDDEQLLDLIAEEAWSDVVLNKDIPI